MTSSLQRWQQPVQYEKLPRALHQLLINLQEDWGEHVIQARAFSSSSLFYLTELLVLLNEHRQRYLELPCGGVERVLHQVRVVTASL